MRDDITDLLAYEPPTELTQEPDYGADPRDSLLKPEYRLAKPLRELKGFEEPRLSKLEQALAAGCTIKNALIYANVSRKWWPRLRRVVERLREDEFVISLEESQSSEFSALVSAAYRVIQAEAVAESRVVATWISHCTRNWQACAAFLARRFPKDWGGMTHGNGSVNVQINQSMQQTAGKQALVEVVQNLTDAQESEMLAEYERLQELSGVKDDDNES